MKQIMIIVKDSEIDHEVPQKLDEFVRKRLHDAGVDMDKGTVRSERDNVNKSTVYTWKGD